MEDLSMELQQQKARDEDTEQYQITKVSDADNGFSLSFEGTPLTFWISKKYQFIPKPGDVARIYGKLRGNRKNEATRTGNVSYMATDNALVRGLDIIRITKTEVGEKKQRVELFYKPAEKKVEAPVAGGSDLHPEADVRPEFQTPSPTA